MPPEDEFRPSSCHVCHPVEANRNTNTSYESTIPEADSCQRPPIGTTVMASTESHRPFHLVEDWMELIVDYLTIWHRRQPLNQPWWCVFFYGDFGCFFGFFVGFVCFLFASTPSRACVVLRLTYCQEFLSNTYEEIRFCLNFFEIRLWSRTRPAAAVKRRKEKKKTVYQEAKKSTKIWNEMGKKKQSIESIGIYLGNEEVVF